MSNNNQITNEKILHLAKLSQLELSDKEIEKFSIELSAILKYIDKIKEVEISEKIQRDFNLINIFREDENAHQNGQHRDAIIKEMPNTKDDFLVVNKILKN
ncbi:MAG: Asp-tRNA(Asn)/Glu-tRNA(Gln) amidotransferase subunit GatC [Candidatus Pacebacteria bacterium]|nr:Asp-tRNA(Asn)/Glu-tRNA(Gln) amidotransferase subunit GatC [Candidatus Paceibacterota bacterium]